MTGLAASTAFGWWWLDGSVALLIAAWASRTTTGACREQARAAVETGPIAVGRTGTAVPVRVAVLGIGLVRFEFSQSSAVSGPQGSGLCLPSS